MGKAKTPEEKAAIAKAKADAKAAKEAAKLGSAAEVKVVDSKDGSERIYSEKEHGENFLDLAKEFASKKASREIVAA